MSENPPHGFYIDAQPHAGLGETLEALGRRKWTILIVLVLVVAAAVTYGMLRTPLYTAESTVLVSSTGVSAPGEEVEINLETERGLASSLVVATEVVEDLGLDEDPAVLAEDIEVDAVTDTEFLVFSYSSPDPEEAQ